jgi:hypothetical protein
MLKRTVFLFLTALYVITASPAAKAEIELPSCYPCGR